MPNTQVKLEEAADNAYLSNYESVLSLTTEALPDFWFYVPYSSEDITEFEFVLQDESGDEVYQETFISHHETPGIVQITLPETLSPLRLDATYQWFFLTHCESGATALSPEVGGWIRRVELASNLQTQLDNATALEMASIYASVYLSSTNCLYQKFFGDGGSEFSQHSATAFELAVCHQLLLYL